MKTSYELKHRHSPLAKLNIFVVDTLFANVLATSPYDPHTTTTWEMLLEGGEKKLATTCVLNIEGKSIKLMVIYARPA